MVGPRTLLFVAAALTSLVDALPGADLLRAGEGEARAGEKGLVIPLSIANDQAIQGFSISLWYSSRDLSVVSVTYAGTASESLSPEYFQTIRNAAAGNVALAVVFEVSAPYDLVSLAPSPSALQEVARITFDLKEDAVPGSSLLRLGDSQGVHPIRNVFTVLGTSVVPALEPGSVHVLPRMFRRGLVNADDRTDISDSIFLFSYLFLGGPPPACFASANMNGDSRVDLSDAIWLLSYIFRGGLPPPEPFTECGDAAGDPLPAPCTGAAVCP